jgi:hypothetical protein
VAEVVADHGRADRQRLTRAQPVVGLGEVLGDARAHEILHGLERLGRRSHQLAVARPIQLGGRGLGGGLVVLGLPARPLGIGGQLAEHIGDLLGRLRRGQLLGGLPETLFLGRLLGDVLEEPIAQIPALARRQLANLLIGQLARRLVGQGAVKRLLRDCVRLELLAVERRARAAEGRHMVVGILLEDRRQILDPVETAVGLLGRDHGVERLAIFLGPGLPYLLEERRRLNVRENVRRRVAVRRARADVAAQRRRQVARLRVERPSHAGRDPGFKIQTNVGSSCESGWQPIVLILRPLHDRQIARHPLKVRVVDVRRQPIETDGVDLGESVAPGLVDREVVGGQADRVELLHGGLDRSLAQRHLERILGGASSAATSEARASCSPSA